MAKRDVTVWMDEHVYCALSECLPEGTSIEQELARMLERLYEQTVPAEERREGRGYCQAGRTGSGR